MGCEYAEPVGRFLQKIHDRLRKPEQADEQRAHNQPEDEQAPNPVYQDGVGFLGQSSRLGIVEDRRLGGDDALGDAVNPAVVGFDVGLHGIDAQKLQTAMGAREQGFHGELVREAVEIGSVVADEEPFGQGHTTGGIARRVRFSKPLDGDIIR